MDGWMDAVIIHYSVKKAVHSPVSLDKTGQKNIDNEIKLTLTTVTFMILCFLFGSSFLVDKVRVYHFPVLEEIMTQYLYQHLFPRLHFGQIYRGHAKSQIPVVPLPVRDVYLYPAASQLRRSRLLLATVQHRWDN